MSDHTTEQTTNEIPYGYCHCGCGQKTKISPQDNKHFGHKKGEPVRFISGHQFRLQPTKTLTERFWPKVCILGPDDCWEWQGCKSPDGYGNIKTAGKYSPGAKAHRVAYELTYGPIPDGLLVCHKCDNPSCCNPAHLFLGTNADNVADKVAKQRQARGNQSPHAKLTAEKVAEIRELYAGGGVTIDQVATRYGIAATTAANIIHRRKWKHVP